MLYGDLGDNLACMGIKNCDPEATLMMYVSNVSHQRQGPLLCFRTCLLRQDCHYYLPIASESSYSEIDKMGKEELCKTMDVAFQYTTQEGNVKEDRENSNIDLLTAENPPLHGNGNENIRVKFPPDVFTTTDHDGETALRSIDGLHELDVEHDHTKDIYSAKEGKQLFSINVATGAVEEFDKIHIVKKKENLNHYNEQQNIERLGLDKVKLMPKKAEADMDIDIELDSSFEAITAMSALNVNVTEDMDIDPTDGRDKWEKAKPIDSAGPNTDEQAVHLAKFTPIQEDAMEQAHTEAAHPADNFDPSMDNTEQVSQPLLLTEPPIDGPLKTSQIKQTPRPRANRKAFVKVEKKRDTSTSSYEDPDHDRKRKRRDAVTPPVTRQSLQVVPANEDLWKKMEARFRRTHPDLSWEVFKNMTYTCQIKLLNESRKILSEKPPLPGNPDGSSKLNHKLMTGPNTISYNAKALSDSEKGAAKLKGKEDNFTFKKLKKGTEAKLAKKKKKLKAVIIGPPTDEDAALIANAMDVSAKAVSSAVVTKEENKE